jgi:hypothetical protein
MLLAIEHRIALSKLQDAVVWVSDVIIKVKKTNGDVAD